METTGKVVMANSNESQPHAGKLASTVVTNWHAVHIDGQEAAIEEFWEQLQDVTSRCEESTASAVSAAQPHQLSALDTGIEEWKRALCAAATGYFNTCLKLVLNNRADFVAEKKPTDVAHQATAKVLSKFLRVSALEGKEEGSDGRVRWFIRHVCGDWSDVLGPKTLIELLEEHESGGDSSDVVRESATAPVFQLPSWAARRGFGARLAGWPIPPLGGTLSSEYAERFILDAEAKVTAGLRAALSRARRTATIEIAKNPLPLSKLEEPAVNGRSYRTPYEGLTPAMKLFDHSDYMLDAQLTPSQYDSFSLSQEYGRPVAEVARRLGIAWKTAQEHIASANKKITNARVNQSANRKASVNHHRY
jgi:hypothetical protein